MAHSGLFPLRYHYGCIQGRRWRLFFAFDFNSSSSWV